MKKYTKPILLIILSFFANTFSTKEILHNILWSSENIYLVEGHDKTLVYEYYKDEKGTQKAYAEGSFTVRILNKDYKKHQLFHIMNADGENESSYLGIDIKDTIRYDKMINVTSYYSEVVDNPTNEKLLKSFKITDDFTISVTSTAYENERKASEVTKKYRINDWGEFYEMK